MVDHIKAPKTLPLVIHKSHIVFDCSNQHLRDKWSLLKAELKKKTFTRYVNANIQEIKKRHVSANKHHKPSDPYFNNYVKINTKVGSDFHQLVKFLKRDAIHKQVF